MKPSGFLALHTSETWRKAHRLHAIILQQITCCKAPAALLLSYAWRSVCVYLHSSCGCSPPSPAPRALCLPPPPRAPLPISRQRRWVLAWAAALQSIATEQQPSTNGMCAWRECSLARKANQICGSWSWQISDFTPLAGAA